MTSIAGRVMYVVLKGAKDMNASQYAFVGTYEVREIPKGWQHPRDGRGRYVPLLPFGYPFDDSQEPSPTMTKTSRSGAAIFTPRPPATSYPMHE